MRKTASAKALPVAQSLPHLNSESDVSLRDSHNSLNAARTLSEHSRGHEISSICTKSITPEMSYKDDS